MTRKKNHFFLLLGLTFPDFSGIIFPVSERKNNMKNEIETKRAEQVARGCQPTWGMTLPEYYAYQEKRREAHFAAKKEMKKSSL
jgi:hypothetical protein